MNKTQQMVIAECVVLLDTLIELEDLFKDFVQNKLVTSDVLLTPACLQEIEQKRQQRIVLLNKGTTP